MTSTSSLGTTSITIQFDLSRNIDGAARDVEAAINAARTYLPANLPANPTYRKVNPADAPIMIIGLTSDKYGPEKLYDEASTVIEQKLSQIQGVGQVNAGGGALPSVRVEVNPTKLASYGLTMTDVQSVLRLQNSDLAKGQITDGITSADIVANDQISHAEDYRPIIVGYKKGATIRLSDVADVVDSVQNLRAAGYLNGKRAVMLICCIHFFAKWQSDTDSCCSRARVTHWNIFGDVSLRLQPGQPVVDGPDDCHRVCGRRRDCGDGKHYATPRSRDGTVCGHTEGGRGNRVHGSFDQYFADRCVYSAVADGRHRWAAVP
jgi:AcrB/AcrD/AcrF family